MVFCVYIHSGNCWSFRYFGRDLKTIGILILIFLPFINWNTLHRNFSLPSIWLHWTICLHRRVLSYFLKINLKNSWIWDYSFKVHIRTPILLLRAILRYRIVLFQGNLNIEIFMASSQPTFEKLFDMCTVVKFGM